MVKPENWVEGGSVRGGKVAEEVIVEVVVRSGNVVGELLKPLFVQGQLNLSEQSAWTEGWRPLGATRAPALGIRVSVWGNLTSSSLAILLALLRTEVGRQISHPEYQRPDSFHNGGKGASWICPVPDRQGNVKCIFQVDEEQSVPEQEGLVPMRAACSRLAIIVLADLVGETMHVCHCLELTIVHQISEFACKLRLFRAAE